uniref:Uncharacterized protein n=1 Tax=Anguilla anguilla TaxID=7936 RepID=A0A0E9T4X6_ANGAN
MHGLHQDFLSSNRLLFLIILDCNDMTKRTDGF